MRIAGIGDGIGDGIYGIEKLLFPSVLALLAIGLSWIRFGVVKEGVFFDGGGSAENIERVFSAADSRRHGQLKRKWKTVGGILKFTIYECC